MALPLRKPKQEDPQALSLQFLGSVGPKLPLTHGRSFSLSRERKRSLDDKCSTRLEMITAL